PPAPPAPTPEAPLTPAGRPRLFAPVALALVGDINLGTLTIPDGVPPDGGRGLFDAARSALTGDLVVGNLEGVLADSGTTYKCGKEGTRVGGQPQKDTTLRARPRKRARPERRRRPPADSTAQPRLCYAFLTPTALAPRLRDAGFTHLSLANNHANDFGPDGRRSTESLLDSLGIGRYGPLGDIAVDSVHRGDSLTTVGLIGFTTYPYAYDLLDISRSAAVVDSVRPLVDLLIVTFHAGSEGAKALHVPEAAESLASEPRGDLRRWARAVIDAGADAVVGHGPHVLRGIEFYRAKPIAYSLGNFLTYRGFNLAGPLGITGVLQLEFAPDRRLRRARLVPMLQLPREGPAPDSTVAALELVRRLSLEDFGESGARISPEGEITAPRH
ncbi:MAG: CapA family protein, partial [Gemmatimonadales bacterium]